MSTAAHRTAGSEKIGEPFFALLHRVILSKEYLGLSHTARSLLTLLALQYRGANNGHLVATPRFLRPLGWRSNDVTTRCIAELMASGLIVRTRLGARPNRAAWYGIAWLPLNGTQAEFDDLDLTQFRKFCGTPIAPSAGIGDKKIVVPRDGGVPTSIAPRDGGVPTSIAPRDGGVPTKRLHRATVTI
jgi:hypothetical protein